MKLRKVLSKVVFEKLKLHNSLKRRSVHFSSLSTTIWLTPVRKLSKFCLNFHYFRRGMENRKTQKLDEFVVGLVKQHRN